MYNLKKKVGLFFSGIINRYFDIYIKGDKRPVFFNIEETYPQLEILTKNIEVIKKELDYVKKGTYIPSYHEVDQYQYKISAVENPEKKWKTYMLNVMGDYTIQGIENCPQTCALLREIPNVFQAFFSILDPNKSIPAHEGPYRGYLRYHLALQVPVVNPPSIRVKDQVYTWKENESVLFDDSWNHEVINKCTFQRTILIVDVLRPLPKMPHLINQFIMNHLLKRFYGKKLMKNLKNEPLLN